MRRMNVNRNVEGIKVKLIISAFHCVRCVHIDGVIPQHGVRCCTSCFAIVPFPSRTHRVRVKLIQINENLMPLNVAGLCGRRYCWLSSASSSLRFDCRQTMRHTLTQLLYLHSNHCVMKCKQISFVWDTCGSGEMRAQTQTSTTILDVVGSGCVWKQDDNHRQYSLVCSGHTA